MMNKTVKMASAAVLSFSLIAPLSGCGSVTAQSLAGKIVDNMADVQSAEESVSMDFDGTVNLTSYNTSIGMTIQATQDSEITIDPLVTHSTGTLSMSFLDSSETMDFEDYTVLEDNVLTIYETSDGDPYVKYTQDMTDDEVTAVSSLYNEDLIQGIADGSIEAELAEDTETFHDEECYVITSTVSGDQLQSTLDQTGLSDVLMEFMTSDDLADVSLPITIYVGKDSKNLAGMVIDMADLGQALFDNLLAGQDLGDYEVAMDTFQTEVAMSDYNSIDSIEIPEDALNADEYTDSGLFSGSNSNTSTATSTPTAAATAEAASTAATDSQVTTGSADWTTMSFTLDSTDYVLPFAYQDIASIWSFSTADYGYPDGYVTNPGDKQAATISLNNSQYDMDFQVGLANVSSSTQDITENSVWAVSMSIEWASSWPSITLPGGITWGSTLDEIYAAYGTPTEEPYYSDSLQYYSLTYRTDDYGRYMRLTVYDDGGLMAVSLEDYDV